MLSFTERFRRFAIIWTRTTISDIAKRASPRLIRRYTFILKNLEYGPIAAIEAGDMSDDYEYADLWQYCAEEFWSAWSHGHVPQDDKGWNTLVQTKGMSRSVLL